MVKSSLHFLGIGNDTLKNKKFLFNMIVNQFKRSSISPSRAMATSTKRQHPKQPTAPKMSSLLTILSLMLSDPKKSQIKIIQWRPVSSNTLKTKKNSLLKGLSRSQFLLLLLSVTLLAQIPCLLKYSSQPPWCFEVTGLHCIYVTHPPTTL